MNRLFTRINLAQRAFSYRSAHAIRATELRLMKYGDVETSLELNTYEMDIQKLKDDEVLVKLIAAPINPADMNIIQGKYASLPSQLPAVVGNEGLFEVLDINESNARGLKRGDWLLPARLGWGSWRSHSIEKCDSFYKIPNTLDKHASATLMVNPMTAYRMLRDFRKLKKQETIIQNGANSGVGQAVIQMARSMNLNIVNIVRRRENSDEQNELFAYLRSLGAEYIFAEDELRKPALMHDLWKQIARPRLAFNCVSGKQTSDMIRLLDNDATVVTYGGMSRQPLTLNTADFIFKDLKCVGFWLTRWKLQNPSEIPAAIEAICDLIKQGALKPPKCEELPISDFQKAFKRAQAPFTNTKVLLTASSS
jgi:mitochondrial enoyl-[acyl-carrier protein] reductase / trans-2-enoyl-CoA reductase